MSRLGADRMNQDRVIVCGLEAVQSGGIDCCTPVGLSDRVAQRVKEDGEGGALG